jgi:hypothetical protein
MEPARKTPTLADLDALPADLKGEIIEGVLYTMTRPRGQHQRTGLLIGGELVGPLRSGAEWSWWLVDRPRAWDRAPEYAGDRTGRRRLAARAPSGPSRRRTDPRGARLDRRDPVAEHAPARSARQVAVLREDRRRAPLADRSVRADDDCLPPGVRALARARRVRDEHEARVEPFAEAALDVAGWWL